MVSYIRMEFILYHYSMVKTDMEGGNRGCHILTVCKSYKVMIKLQREHFPEVVLISEEQESK